MNFLLCIFVALKTHCGYNPREKWDAFSSNGKALEKQKLCCCSFHIFNMSSNFERFLFSLLSQSQSKGGGGTEKISICLFFFLK